MEYPTVYDLFCYDMVTGQRVRIIREDYEGLRIIVNNQEVYRPYRDLRKLQEKQKALVDGKELGNVLDYQIKQHLKACIGVLILR